MIQKIYPSPAFHILQKRNYQNTRICQYVGIKYMFLFNIFEHKFSYCKAANTYFCKKIFSNCCFALGSLECLPQQKTETAEQQPRPDVEHCWAFGMHCDIIT